MFIAMNRFRVTKGSEAAFEHVWLSRDSHLDKVPGFVEFQLLKGSEVDDHTLYASHTVANTPIRIIPVQRCSIRSSITTARWWISAATFVAEREPKG